MKIQNITSSIRSVKDLSTNEIIMVKPNEIVELEKVEFNTIQFKVIKAKIEQKEKKITEKEVI